MSGSPSRAAASDDSLGHKPQESRGHSKSSRAATAANEPLISCRRYATRLGLALVLAACVLIHTGQLQGHEIRPALLHITEREPGWFDVMWKVPIRGDMRLRLEPQLPESLEPVGQASERLIPGASVQNLTMKSDGSSIVGDTVTIDGLSALQIDVLLRIELADGTSHSVILRPSSTSFTIPARPSNVELAWSYFLIGIKHILEGVDHLLFILGLVLIVRSTSMLIKTITAFTLAHSITLAIATLGLASTPLPPLNVLIALSILFLGPEIVRVWRGQTSFTIRHPWVVAFAFGLLHGFGFASGLEMTGLPTREIVLALLMFNVGVEAGQLFFVALTIAMIHSFAALEIRWPRWAEWTPGYAVGSLGALWVIQRTVMMFGV